MINRFITLIISLVIFNNIIGHSKNIGMIVVEESLDVYEYPCTFSNIITTLNAGFFVVYRPELVDKSLSSKYGNWLYVDTGKYENPANGEKIIFGWVRKSGVAEPDEFERVTNFESFKVIGSVGDSYWNYTFYEDGTYIRYNEKGRKIKGKVYKKWIVFLARDSVPTDSKYYLYNIFVLDRKGYYNFPCEDENGEQVRIKSKIYSQFNSQNSDDGYYILTVDNVNVRAEATTNSKVLLQLKKGTKVKVLERSEKEFTVEDTSTGRVTTGHWVYIDTGVKDKKGKAIKGWVVDIYLKTEE